MKARFYFLFLFFYILPFSKAEETQPPLTTFNLSIPSHYETCSCTNNTYTQHITSPYKLEIETWLLQTGEDIQFSTQNFLCPDCDTTEESSFLEYFITAIDDIESWFTSFFEEEREIIHPLCFQMGRKLVDKKGSKRQFFSCIHSHYDGSQEDYLCRDTTSDSSSPKQCIATPISCEDVQNTELTCVSEFENRPDEIKSDGCNRGASFPRRPCFNQFYTAMTMKAFYDVTQCLEVDDQLAFPLLFHESRFILNIKSHTGALCYGQVTGQAVADFNSLLEGKLYSQLSSIVDKQRCPQAWSHFKKIKTNTFSGQERLRSSLSRCHLNLNPYTCLFYSVGYLKILMHLMEDIVEQENNFRRYGRIALEDQNSSLESQEKEVTEINIFEDKQSLINILAVIGYNGGAGIRRHFTKYMESLREILQEDEGLRRTLLRDGLSSEYFEETFTEFLSKNYPGSKRRKEVSEFLDKIKLDVSRLNQFIKDHNPEAEENLCPSL